MHIPFSFNAGVVIHELRIIVADRPDIVLSLDTPEKVLAVESNRLVVKEGLAFSSKLIFSVHHEVVLGLRFTQKVTRLGMTCDTINQMIGSYPVCGLEFFLGGDEEGLLPDLPSLAIVDSLELSPTSLSYQLASGLAAFLVEGHIWPRCV